MKIVQVESWDGFQREVKSLENHREELQNKSDGHVSELLFRGQPNACWSLKTTLERSAEEEVPIHDYYDLVERVKPEIEVFTGKAWDGLENGVSDQEIEEACLSRKALPAYEYLAYLRHHGFPSPLLDWTTSPWIAAHFALSRAVERIQSVSIYAYLEYGGHGKTGTVGKVRICSLGPTIRTHTRHFLQRSQYTFCCKQLEDKCWGFASHEEAFKENATDQDCLWKFVLPATERKAALAYLDRFNISSFSLFGSEESLMETLAIRELVIRR